MRVEPTQTRPLPRIRSRTTRQTDLDPSAPGSKIASRTPGVVLQSLPAGPIRSSASVLMKARIIITPKKAVLDPQGKTVQNALEHMGHSGITGVHVGKYIEIDLAPGTDKDAAEKSLRDAAHRFLSNPVIEDFRLELVD